MKGTGNFYRNYICNFGTPAKPEWADGICADLEAYHQAITPLKDNDKRPIPFAACIHHIAIALDPDEIKTLYEKELSEHVIELEEFNEKARRHFKDVSFHLPDELRLYHVIKLSGTGRPLLMAYFPEMEDAQTYDRLLGKFLEEKFRELLEPDEIPDMTELRFSHMAIFSPPRTGKSNLLSNLIYEDLIEVAKGRRSVIVMETNADLIKGVQGLAEFAPGMPLAGKLIVVDVEDVEYPVALNLFDLGQNAGKEATALEREVLHNFAVEMLDYIFGALLQTELTGRQKTLFSFTVSLMLSIPGATLDTMIEVLSSGNKHPLSACDRYTREFFETKFDSKEFSNTRAEVVDRLYAVRRNLTLARMLSAPQTKLNLFAEMGQGKVILINAASGVLGETGAEMYGRFWLAMILMAAHKRMLTPKASRLDTHVYFDECQDFVKNDTKIPITLDQARKFRVGVTLATQRLDYISPPVLNAIISSTAIKFASRLSDANAHTLARNMRCEPAFIMNQPQWHHALYVQGDKKARSVTYPLCELGKKLRMTEAQAAAVRDEMRRKYCNHISDLEPSTDGQEAEAPVKKRAKAARAKEGIKPTSDW